VFLGKEFGHEANYSDDVAATIDLEVRRLIDDAHREAREILSLHRATLDRLADALIEHETLEETALREILGPLAIWESAGASRPGSPVREAGRSLDVISTEFNGPVGGADIERGPRPFPTDD
jgi:hypothetical protein